MRIPVAAQRASMLADFDVGADFKAVMVLVLHDGPVLPPQGGYDKSRRITRAFRSSPPASR
jgi:hypothetical protein